MSTPCKTPYSAPIPPLKKMHIVILVVLCLFVVISIVYLLAISIILVYRAGNPPLTIFGVIAAIMPISILSFPSGLYMYNLAMTNTDNPTDATPTLNSGPSIT